jgi:phosphonate transport system permease protein
LATTEERRLDELIVEFNRRGRVETARNLTLGLLFLALGWATYSRTEFNPAQLLRGTPNMGRLLAGFVHPNLAIIAPGSGSFPEGLVEHFILETLAMAFLGTVLGSLAAIPVSFLAARNLMRRNPLGTAIYFLMRTLMSVIRSVPTLFWGILFVTAVALGPFPGVLAIAIFSFGLMSKLFSEAIEAIDWGPVEALTATGARPEQVVVHGVLPQVGPYLVANLLYTFEVNVHSATILGVVGAGGIGFLLIQYIDQFQYDNTAMLLLLVIAMTLVIDYSSAAIRRRMI